MPLSNYAKDRFIAPHLSKFTHAKIEDLSQYDSQQTSWTENFLLNTLLISRVPNPQREYILNYLRRVQTAFEEFELARNYTQGYLASQTGVSSYFYAQHHWEVTLNLMWQSLRTLKNLYSTSPPFIKGDLSTEEKLNTIANAMKHAEGRILEGKMPKEGGLPVWLTNEGLESVDTKLAFNEIAEYLKQLGHVAGRLSNPSSAKSTNVN